MHPYCEPLLCVRHPISPPIHSPCRPPTLVIPAGDIHAYDALCMRHAAQLNGQPALVEHERRMREKITILCVGGGGGGG